MSASDPNFNPGAPLIGGGGGATLPDTPAAVLLDAGAADTIVGLDATGVGETLTYAQTRTALGLGGAALLGVGTSAGTVCAGDDSRVTGAVQASTLTTNGDILTRTAGVPARLGLGSALQVLRTNAGATALEYATPAGVTQGTYAAMIALTPAIGDQYVVTSGNRVGSSYSCIVAGVWSFMRAAPPVTTCEYYLDAETLQIATGAWLNTWRDEITGNVGAMAVNSGVFGPTATIVATANAAGGLPAATFSGSGSMRGTWVGPQGAATRWIAAVISSTATNAATFEHVVHYGSASSGQAYGLVVRAASTAQWGNHYWATSWAAGGTPPTTATPVLALIQYSGTVDNLYVDGNSALTNTVTLNTGNGYPINIGAVINSGSEPLVGRLHAVLCGSGNLDSAQRAALRTWSQARWGTA